MANLQTKDFQTLVREQVTAIQGGSKTLADLSVGSILRVIVEAYSAVALWLQGMILQLLATTRAATSSGTDLDTWVADYGVTRLPATVASGQVTFSRFTPTAQAVVSIGVVVQTTDGTQQYAVALDSTNSSYSAAQGGYVLTAGTVSLNLPVKALTPGASGNASANGINTLGQAIPGVDTVANAANFTNGADAETDEALRTRFINYIKSLSKATKDAVGNAVTSTQQGLNYTLTENQSHTGTPQLGYFYLVVDDGTGTLTDNLKTTIYNAVDAVRPVTSSFGVFAPDVVTVSVSMNVTTSAGYDHAQTVVLIIAALMTYINALPLGTSLAWSRLAQVAYDASPGVTNVSNVLLNNATLDIPINPNQVLKAGTITVN